MSLPVQGFPPAPAVTTPAPAPTVVVQGTPSMSAPPIPMSGVPAPTTAPAAAPPTAPAPAQYVFQGENIPPELRGATPEQVVEYYGKLREFYFQHASAQSAPPVPAPVSAPSIPTPPPAPPAPEPSAADFWSQPIDTIRQVIRAEMQPVTQATMRDAVVQARNTVAAADPNYAQMEGEVLQQLQGVSTEALADPRTWELAYNIVLGQRVRRGQMPAAAPAPAPSAPAPAPSRFAPTTFFTEPAKSGGSTGSALPTHDAQKQEVARKMGLTMEQYSTWERMLGGNRNG